MVDGDKQTLINRYTERLNVFGYDPKTLGWGNGGRDRQKLRFRTLMEIGIQNEHSVLDVGCGFGDLYGYLTETGWNGEYLGVDINEDLLEVAKRKYPDINVKCLDILKEDIGRQYNFVVESGIFNEKLNFVSNNEHIEKMLRKMYDLCEDGVGADFLSSYVDFQADGAYHSDPGNIIKMSKKLTNKLIVRMDYLPFEFMIYCYK